MKLPRFILPLAALVPLAGPGCLRHADAPPPFNVRTVAVQPPGALPRESGPAFLGVVRGDSETSLSFKVSGQLVRIGPAGGDADWNEGVAVPAGAELAQLDTANFVSSVASARARAELARATFARNSELYAAANLSVNDFESSRAQKETAEADLAQAEQALRDTTLRAPYGGVILSRAAKSGEFASAGKAVLKLGDFRRVSLEVGVPDTLLGEVAVGQRYPVRVAAFESEIFEACVSEVGTAASDGSRLFRVVLKIDNASARLKSGMTASVRLGGAQPAPVAGILVPLSAIVSSSTVRNAPAVFVVAGGNAARERTVRTADIVGSSILVTDGLAAGDQVVTLGAGQLFDGAAVAIVGK
ncbi:MAG TPA: efflux RND transporter periplasmic adaptor subunit [Opitutus sp.]|nr:efflux RND transporter periplasmic adaptor subunit [Opitutus sp.]